MSALAWVKAAHIAASALLAGAFAFQILVLRRIAPPAGSAALALRVRGQLRALAISGVVAGAVSWLAWLGLLAISMSGRPAAEALTPSVLGTVVAQTTFGHVWSLRATLWLAIAVLLLWPAGKQGGGSPPRHWITAGLALLVVCSLGWAGHAVGTQPLHALVDAVHLLAASVWLGMLPPLWLVIRRACKSAEPASADLAAAAARLFSLPGMVAVGVLALTGLGNALWLLDTPRDLVATKYGLVLLAKLSAFGLMLLLAASNRLLLAPAAQSAASQAARLQALRRLQASVLLEVALGALVLVLVGILGVTAPGTHGAGAHHMHDMRDM
ncbi:CopD family protein [Ramlibacter sp.]|uniref:CopD family protein n=1 Tax=Ramlibacter sp. TaxID=1917967 RepID=UPI002620664F|nr:CopD family protein [Ramlibacter sp.]MDB5958094.1 copper resistance [Ramlibacter sp.]